MKVGAASYMIRKTLIHSQFFTASLKVILAHSETTVRFQITAATLNKTKYYSMSIEL